MVKKKEEIKEEVPEEVEKESYFSEIKSEMKKVKWPTKKEMIKYTISTLCFVILFAVYFFGIESLFAFIEGLFR